MAQAHRYFELGTNIVGTRARWCARCGCVGVTLTGDKAQWYWMQPDLASDAPRHRKYEPDCGSPPRLPTVAEVAADQWLAQGHGEMARAALAAEADRAHELRARFPEDNVSRALREYEKKCAAAMSALCEILPGDDEEEK